MAFCSLFSPKKLGVSASKFSPFLVPCSALQHFGLLPWWLKRPTIVWRRMQRRMRRIICWNTRPSKWTRRTCRWNRDLADLYWFMVEQLVIKLIQPLKVNVHAVSKLSSTLVIYFFFNAVSSLLTHVLCRRMIVWSRDAITIPTWTASGSSWATGNIVNPIVESRQIATGRCVHVGLKQCLKLWNEAHWFYGIGMGKVFKSLLKKPGIQITCILLQSQRKNQSLKLFKGESTNNWSPIFFSHQSKEPPPIILSVSVHHLLEYVQHDAVFHSFLPWVSMILYVKLLLFWGKFFSYWPDKGCQLQDSEGDFRWVSNKAYSEVLSGPAVCGEEELGAAPGGNSNYLDFSTSSSADWRHVLFLEVSHWLFFMGESQWIWTVEGFFWMFIFLHLFNLFNLLNPLCKKGIYWETSQLMRSLFRLSPSGIACRIPPIPAVPVVLAVCPSAPQIINGPFGMDVPMLLRDIVMSPAPRLHAKTELKLYNKSLQNWASVHR